MFGFYEIQQELLAHIARNCDALLTVSDFLKHWDDVPADMQPALYMTTGSPRVEHQTNQRPRWFLRPRFYLYVRNSESPQRKLFYCLEQIAKAMEPSSAVQEKQTLGGLCHYARLVGEIETDDGTLGEQAVAMFSIEILTAI